jgi:hypothetical protein
LNGLTRTGRQRLVAGCSLLEERRRCLSFWTITLDDSVMAELLELDSWHVFQGRIRQLLTRHLAEHGLEPLVLAVVELHPKRSIQAGQALPHLHVLFQGKADSRQGWAFRPDQLDELIIRALAFAGVTREAVPAAGKVEQIRKSVRRYLAKYVSKAPRQLAAGSDLAMLGDPRLCPRQWWFMSARLLALIVEATRFLPPEFLAWLCDNRTPPRPGAPYVVQRAAIPDPRAPDVWVVSFRSAWTLFLMWERYEKALRFGERISPPRRTNDCSLTRIHPQRDQLV